MRQGLTYLYIYDLREAKLRQLTNDAYADLHPAWSPDSRRIAFVTDRFTSDLESLHMGPPQLAIADGDTGAIERVPAFAAARHINPHWSPDGQSLYFISDPDGIPNVYRLALAHGTTERITAVATGVSGITPSSPALSVSSGSGRESSGSATGPLRTAMLRCVPGGRSACQLMAPQRLTSLASSTSDRTVPLAE